MLFSGLCRLRLLCFEGTLLSSACFLSVIEEAMLKYSQFTVQLIIISATCAFKFCTNSPLQGTALEDFFWGGSMTESRRTPIPGAASRWFSICRNYSKEKHTSDKFKYVNMKQPPSSYETAHCISTNGNPICKNFQVNLQQLWTEPYFSMQSSALSKHFIQ